MGRLSVDIERKVKALVDAGGFEPSKEDYDNILRAAREAVNPSIRYEEIKEFVVNHSELHNFGKI